MWHYTCNRVYTPVCFSVDFLSKQTRRNRIHAYPRLRLKRMQAHTLIHKRMLYVTKTYRTCATVLCIRLYLSTHAHFVHTSRCIPAYVHTGVSTYPGNCPLQIHLLVRLWYSIWLVRGPRISMRPYSTCSSPISITHASDYVRALSTAEVYPKCDATAGLCIASNFCAENAVFLGTLIKVETNNSCLVINYESYLIIEPILE